MWLSKRNEPLETKTQSDAREYALKRRWKFALKIAWGTVNGMPDYFFAKKGVPCPHCGRSADVLFIEFKKEGEEPTRQQLERHQELRDCGIKVVWVDNLEDAKRHLR